MNNKKKFVAIKTPVGKTESEKIETKVMQGNVWDPSKCPNQIHKCKCGCESLLNNAIISTKNRSQKA